MPVRRRIVVGVDGSPASVAALAWAAGEAQLRHAELHAVYAWEDPERCRAPYAAHCGLSSRDENQAAAASLLARSVCTAFGRSPPRRLRAEAAEGRPERVLLDCAVGAELLALGSAWRAGDFPAMGPIHRACLRGVSCPIVFVAPGETGSRSARSPSVAGSGAEKHPGSEPARTSSASR